MLGSAQDEKESVCAAIDETPKSEKRNRNSDREDRLWMFSGRQWICSLPGYA